MVAQSAVLMAIIFCMQAAMGQIVPNAPAGCNCYSHGDSGIRTPCGTDGCSASSTVNCAGGTSLILFYPNPADAGSPNSTVGDGSSGSPSVTASRYGACSCPGVFLSYGGSGNKANAYFVVSGSPSGSAFQNITSCSDFGKFAGGVTNDQAAVCCTACCFPASNLGD